MIPPIIASFLYTITYNLSDFWSDGKEIPILIDSGASLSITKISSDLIGKISPMDAPIQGLSATTKIKGMGTIKSLFVIQKVPQLLLK